MSFFTKKEDEKLDETEKLAIINKKISEVKKRILLEEGKKKAHFEEFEKQKRQNAEVIGNFKKEIKDMTAKLTYLQNPNSMKALKTPQEVVRKVQYPTGAKNPEEAVTMMAEKVIEGQKQLDLIRYEYKKRQKLFSQRVEEYNELLAYKNSQNVEHGGPPPETLEEDSNRKLVCHLENEIHRTTVQWMEAEHIRKKYRAIKASLMNDAEKFEQSLRDLEEAMVDQQSEINRLREVNKQAIEMRDAAKIILQRQEQQAHMSNKAREKQALDFRKQVEERKIELERIERKLFSSGAPGKALVHQESIGSSSGDQQTGKTEQDDEPNSQLKAQSEEMEAVFKQLMEVTGATSPEEVLERFLSQKESTSRLNYLRTAAEAEKKHLETQRELLTAELDASKFANMQENEVNQELVEKIKTEIIDLTKDRDDNSQEIEKTKKVIEYIKGSLIEMVFKLQEVDECDVHLPKSEKTIPTDEINDYLKNDIVNLELLDILEEKLKRVFTAAGIIEKEDVGVEEDEDVEDLYVPIVSPRTPSTIDEKPPPLPMCYINLLTGRGGQTSSASPGQPVQPGKAATDDESEVPSRNFLKRQAMLIVDSKSRRKGFRPTAQRRK